MIISLVKWSQRCIFIEALYRLQVLSRLRHPHIVAFLGAYLAPPNVCIVEELVEGGSLFDHLHGRNRLGPTKQQSFQGPLTPLTQARRGDGLKELFDTAHDMINHQ